MTNEINELETIRKAVTEIALKVQGLLESQQRLQLSLFALQTYVANGVHPKDSEQALHDILELTRIAIERGLAGSIPTSVQMATLLKALQDQKPGKA